MPVLLCRNCHDEDCQHTNTAHLAAKGCFKATPKPKKDAAKDSTGATGSKPWFSEGQKETAQNRLNEICEYIGCTDRGKTNGARKCKINHFDCLILKELQA